jgi:hypothetical protein
MGEIGVGYGENGIEVKMNTECGSWSAIHILRTGLEENGKKLPL